MNYFHYSVPVQPLKIVSSYSKNVQTHSSKEKNCAIDDMSCKMDQIPSLLIAPGQENVECYILSYEKGLRDIRRLQKLFSRSNLSEEILDIIMDTPSHEMTWIDEEKAAELGLVN